MSLKHDYHYSFFWRVDEVEELFQCGIHFPTSLFSLVLVFSSSSSSSSTRRFSSLSRSNIHIFFRRSSAGKTKRRFHRPSSILIVASLLPLLLLISIVSLLSSRGRSRSRSGRFVHRESPNFTWSAAGSVSFGSSGTRSSGRVGRLLQSYAAAAAGPKPRLERWLFWKDPSPWMSPGGVYRQPEGSCPSSRAPTPDTMEIVIIFVFFGPESSRNVKLYFYLAECS